MEWKVLHERNYVHWHAREGKVEKTFTALSIIFFILSFVLVMGLYQERPFALVEYFYGINLLTPIFFNGFGLISAFFSAKGTTRKTLMFIHSLTIVYFGVFVLIAFFGF